MPGVRIHHPTARNQVIAVECARPYVQPEGYNCPLCNVTHFYKTIHLNLDNEGDVIVSMEVWEELKDLPNFPITMENEVEKPPPLIIGMNSTTPEEQPQVEQLPFEGRR